MFINRKTVRECRDYEENEEKSNINDRDKAEKSGINDRDKAEKSGINIEIMKRKAV